MGSKSSRYVFRCLISREMTISEMQTQRISIYTVYLYLYTCIINHWFFSLYLMQIMYLGNMLLNLMKGNLLSVGLVFVELQGHGFILNYSQRSCRELGLKVSKKHLYRKVMCSDKDACNNYRKLPVLNRGARNTCFTVQS